MDEGYHTITSIEKNTDCDHGPCTGYNLDNGWIVWFYDDKPDLISFHPNFVADIDPDYIEESPWKKPSK